MSNRWWLVVLFLGTIVILAFIFCVNGWYVKGKRKRCNLLFDKPPKLPQLDVNAFIIGEEDEAEEEEEEEKEDAKAKEGKEEEENTLFTHI